jgi:serine protease Do
MVDGASAVTVKLTDRREFKAKVIGIDAPTDTAVLKIDAHDLPTVRIGDPSQTHVGEWVLAIGSPFGFANSVTAGIISAKSRFLPGEAYVPFIQTDVAVNPGNSGGPLFNTKGVVIGINSQIFSQTGGYQGLSFAIPIDIALRVEQQLLRDGRVSRGRLGVSTQDLNQPLADSFGLAKPAGALVDSVLSDGPADEAGLQPGDIILQLNDKDIQASYELPPQVAELTPGSQARLTLWRDGRSKEVTFRVGEMNTMAKIGETSEATEDRLGVAVRPLAPNELRQADVKVGLVVEQSVGPALRAGIQPGDAVLAVNGHPVADAEQLREFVEKANRHIALLVQRDRVRVFVPVDLDEVP